MKVGKGTQQDRYTLGIRRGFELLCDSQIQLKRKKWEFTMFLY